MNKSKLLISKQRWITHFNLVYFLYKVLLLRTKVIAHVLKGLTLSTWSSSFMSLFASSISPRDFAQLIWNIKLSRVEKCWKYWSFTIVLDCQSFFALSKEYVPKQSFKIDKAMAKKAKTNPNMTKTIGSWSQTGIASLPDRDIVKDKKWHKQSNQLPFRYRLSLSLFYRQWCQFGK